MWHFLLLPLAALSTAQITTHDPFYCYARDPIRPQLSMFGPHGQYESVRGNSLETPLSNCTPSKIWLLARGGTRLPNTTQFENMMAFRERLHTRTIANIDLGRDQLCRPDADNILRWQFNESITMNRTFELTQTGWNEMRNLAIRLQRAFPQALPRNYTQNNFRFRHTNFERTNENVNAFADGLFGHSSIVTDAVPTPDRLLRPFDSCTLYNEFRQNFGERDGFRVGPDFLQMTDQVNRKLGLTGPQQISIDQLIALADFCRFEQSWEPTSDSAWCAAFSVANFQVYEYMEDLQNYYVSSYGGDERLFSNMHCHALQDLLRFIENNGTDHLARIHVSHSTILRLFITAIGAFRDQTILNRHNFAQQFARLFRTSFISIHAANVVFVKHDCAAEDNDIVMLYNETPLVIPGCERPGVCKQETLVRLFRRFIDADCLNLYCSRN